MVWRVISAVFAALLGWAAFLQLNDPDPARWFALYAAAAAIATASAAGRALPRAALALALLAAIWASALVPELWGRWNPTDLGATMSAARPEVEYGRELGGLLIVAAYCFAAARIGRRGLAHTGTAVQ